MGAMKNYAIGVCDAHPKEMYDLYDLLCGSEDAATAVAVALIERNGEDVSAARAVWELIFEMDEILENVPQEDSLTAAPQHDGRAARRLGGACRMV